MKAQEVEESEITLIKALGKKIANYRKEQKLTQADLGALINMDEAAIRRIELGGTNPTFKTLYRIAEGLQISLKDLFDTNEP
ncbi:MAG: transcriptional regulator [Flavobacteriales bacterium MED-G15]|nr:MAG: transcriptional regulator [Flavobacteriales bacterium MED-G15]